MNNSRLQSETSRNDPVLDASTAKRWTIIGLSAAVVYVCWPLWAVLVLASWTAEVSRPLLTRLDRVFRGRRRAAAAFSVLLFLALLLPVVAVILGVAAGSKDLASALSETSTPTGALEAIAGGGDGAQPIAPQLPAWPTTLPALFQLLEHYGSASVSVLQSVAGAAASGTIALFVYFGASYIFLVDGPAVWAWALRHSPLKPDYLARLGAAFQETGRGLLVGVGLTSAAQGLAATLIYVSLGVPRWWVLGPLTGVASLIPLIGSGIIWVPIMAGLFLTGHPVKGAVLAVLGIGVIAGVDNVLRPVFARLGALNMPTFLLFVSIFGGLAAFGAWGAILGPLVVRLWLEAIRLPSEGGEPDSFSTTDKSVEPV